MSREKSIEQQRKERFDSATLGEGIKYGILGLVIGGAAVAIGHKTNSNFARFMSPSAKTAIPVMLGLFGFTLKFELTAHEISRYDSFFISSIL